MKQTYDHKELAKILSGITDASQMERLLQAFLTPQELEDLVLRWEIVKLLSTGMPQREIAKTLGVAIGTVSRGAREMKYGQNGFVELIAELQDKSPA